MDEPSSHASSGTQTHVVLIGGGHTHVQVLTAFATNPQPGVRLTLIAKELNAPYSGMLPGLISGHYTFDACHIDLVRLAKCAGAHVIHGEADGIDRAAKHISLRDQSPIPYDIASFDVGITPDLSAIVGADTHAIAVKPISTFWPKWQATLNTLRKTDGPQQLTIVGGGAAGFELSLAINTKLASVRRVRGANASTHHITLIAGDRLLPSHPARARALARSELQRRGIQLIEDDRATAVHTDSVTLQSGRSLPTQVCLITTGAAPPDWFTETDLPLTPDGYLHTRATLQLDDDDTVFAVGDCATVTAHPRAKSGVFAVRQGPPLIENLRRVICGQKARPFKPQRYFLTILSVSNGEAIAARGRLAAQGRWAWLLKDIIDRAFMRRFPNARLAAQSEGGQPGSGRV